MLAWVLLAVGVILIILTALYVTAEFSLVTVDRAAVDKAAATGSGRAASLQAGLRSLSTQLSGAQVGITVTTLALGYVMEPSLAALLAVPLRAVGLSGAAAESVAVVVSLIVATVLSMVFGELVPKSIAIAHPMQAARFVIGPLRATTAASRPLIWVLNGAANGVLRLIGITPQEELRSARSAQELWSLVRHSGARGTLEQRTATLVARSITFSAKTVSDVLTPRVDVLFVRAAEASDTVIAAALESGQSRFPVIDRDADDVIGLVHLKRVVAVPPDDRANVTVRSLMVAAPTVPETVPLDDALELLRGRGLQMAVVIDEYGGTAGIVTLEDLVEELVGEIIDEHDTADDDLHRLDDGSYLVPGDLRPDEIADRTGVRLPDSTEYDTVAGLLIEHLDRIPVVGDSTLVTATLQPDAALGAPDVADAVDADPAAGLPRPVHVRIAAHRMNGRRVTVVQLAAAGPADDDADEDDPDAPRGRRQGSEPATGERGAP